MQKYIHNLYQQYSLNLIYYLYLLLINTHLLISNMAFKPQDFSRFLIREFLKKGGFDKTYESFMKEDTREKTTMTKNELTKLLGIE